MPCYYPIQAVSFVDLDGKKSFKLLQTQSKHMYDLTRTKDTHIAFPCGRCIGCRLERSRQWAVRMTHEAKMHEDTSFVTLTYDDEHLPEDGSLSKREVQLFLKKLRQVVAPAKFRYFFCGEYGEEFERPHYHACFFGLDFKDKVLHHVKNGRQYFSSSALNYIWGKGFCLISDLTFDSAAYVARYCTKKVSGKEAEEHYGGREPEFALMSRKPGLGMPWLEAFGRTDVWTHDEIVVNGIACKPPRYYDIKLEQLDAERFAAFKEARRAKALSKSDDTSWSRLKVKEKCMQSRFKRLAREFETN